jgi:murein DD-endopeptidase MepM/ murein hydrolase activator NlpD
MEVNLKKFLYLPLKRTDYQITEGWRYSEEEKNIHGVSGHGGIDFSVPRGTEVLSAADGWAIASYYWKSLKNQDGSQRTLKDKEIGMGLGYFVQIYHPQENLYTSYGHLDRVSEEIPFHRPIERNGVFWPVGHKVKPENLPHYKYAKFVKTGEVIGFVGDSGLTWGYRDYPQRPDPNKYPSWDGIHLHFEVFNRVGSRGNKKYFDPFGIKSNFNDYPDSDRLNNRKNMGTKSFVLWLIDQEGMPQFSK